MSAVSPLNTFWTVKFFCIYSFKSRLDNFWKSQDALYDYHAEIMVEINGTGSRIEASSTVLL